LGQPPWVVFYLAISDLIFSISDIVLAKVSCFFAKPAYTTHNEYLLHELASAIPCFSIIFPLIQSSHKDLLSMITRFFSLIFLASGSLRSNVLTLKSIVNLSHPVFSTKVILL